MTTPAHERIPQWTLGDRLRKARTLTGLTTREFAALISVSQGAVTGAENGHHKPRQITLNAWAMATGVSLKWLETGEGWQSPPDPGSEPIPTGASGDALARLTEAKRARRRTTRGDLDTHRYLTAA